MSTLATDENRAGREEGNCYTDIEQAMPGARRRNRDNRHAAQFPEQLAVEAVGADLAGARRH